LCYISFAVNPAQLEAQTYRRDLALQLSQTFIVYKYENYYVKFSRYGSCCNLSEQVKPNRTLDCLGLYCPEPVFRVRMELDEMKVGEVLEVLADDPAAEEDIKSLAKRLEQQLINLSKEGNTLRFLIKKVK